MLRRIYFKIYKIIVRRNRNIINFINKLRLKNREFSLISSNCNGAFISHDLSLKFLTPTVNLFLFPKDFIKFAENLSFYLEQKIEFIDNQDYNYPIGKLHDIEIHFVHYKDAQNAKEQWEKRSKRINNKNIFIMMTDRDGCTEDMIRRFDNLPYKNKVIFTNKEYKQYSSAFYIKGFENQLSVGNIYEFQNILGKKYYDNFDYVNWFNSGL